MKKLQLDDGQKKKLDNFWYYYKYHVLAGAFVLFCIITFVGDKIGQVKYDYSIGYLGAYGIPAEEDLNLQKWFEENGEDLNGDGEVHVLINEYPLPEEGENGYDPQMLMASQTKLTVDIQENTSIIFLLSEANYERYKDMGVFPVDEKELVAIKDCKGFEEAGNPVSVQDLFVCKRLIFEDGKDASDEEVQNYYKASERLLEKFIGE